VYGQEERSISRIAFRRPTDTEARIVKVKANGFLVFVPKYGSLQATQFSFDTSLFDCSVFFSAVEPDVCLLNNNNMLT
jgi:hypothetical protein